MSTVDSEGFKNEVLHKQISDWVLAKDSERIVLGYWKNQPITMKVNPYGHIEPNDAIESFYPKFTDETWLYGIGIAAGFSYIMVGDSGRMYVDFNESDNADEVPTHIGYFASVLEERPLPLPWRDLRHFA